MEHDPFPNRTVAFSCLVVLAFSLPVQADAFENAINPDR